MHFFSKSCQKAPQLVLNAPHRTAALKVFKIHSSATRNSKVSRSPSDAFLTLAR